MSAVQITVQSTAQHTSHVQPPTMVSACAVHSTVPIHLEETLARDSPEILAFGMDSVRIVKILEKQRPIGESCVLTRTGLIKENV